MPGWPSSLRFLTDVGYAALVARLGIGHVARRVTEREMADADVLAGAEEYAGARENLLAERMLQLFLGAVNPACMDVERFGGEHHRGDGDAAVAQIVHIVLVRDDEQDDGRTVEGVEALLPMTDLTVQFDELFAHDLVRDDDCAYGFAAHAARRIQPRLDDVAHDVGGRHCRQEGAHAAPLLDRFYDFVHRCASFLAR